MNRYNNERRGKRLIEHRANHFERAARLLGRCRRALLADGASETSHRAVSVAGVACGRARTCCRWPNVPTDPELGGTTRAQENWISSAERRAENNRRRCELDSARTKPQTETRSAVAGGPRAKSAQGDAGKQLRAPMIGLLMSDRARARPTLRRWKHQGEGHLNSLSRRDHYHGHFRGPLARANLPFGPLCCCARSLPAECLGGARDCSWPAAT